MAVGTGFIDGLGVGDNAKAAIIRIGLIEMTRFVDKFYESAHLATIYESCGVADLITACYFDRNRKVAELCASTEKVNEITKQFSFLPHLKLFNIIL